VRGIFIFFSNAELNLSAQPPAPQSSYEFMQRKFIKHTYPCYGVTHV